MDFFGLTVGQISERAVVSLMRGPMPQQIDKIGRTEKRPWQMVNMHGSMNSVRPWIVPTRRRPWERELEA